MFEQAAATFVGKTSLEVIERLDEYRLVFEAADLAPQVARGQVMQLLTLTKQLPSRDRFELQIEFEADVLSIIDNSEASQARVTAHFQSHEDQGEARYELKVRKGTVGTLSIYNLVAFGRYFADETLASVLAALSSRFRDGLDFECMCPVAECGTDTIRFWPRGHTPSTDNRPPSLRSQMLTAFRDNSYNAGLKTDFLPSDFLLLQRTDVASINDFMDKACAVLCAIYLVSSSQIHGSERLTYKLVGYKSVEGEAGFMEFVPALPGLYKIYDWAYGVGGSADRIGLARNVISLHVDRLQDVSDHASLWNAIYSNYQIYLKGNVASYLEVKNKIAEFLVESTAKAHALVEGLVDSLKNSVFVMLTFLLTVVVVNGLKDTGATVIFSAAYVWIVVVLCAVLSVWMIGACRGAIRRFDNSAKTTAEVLQLGYGRILVSREISENIDPINTRNREYLVKQCWRYALYWLLIAALLIGGFGLGYVYIERPHVPSNTTTTHAGQLVGVDAVTPAHTAIASDLPLSAGSRETAPKAPLTGAPKLQSKATVNEPAADVPKFPDGSTPKP